MNLQSSEFQQCRLLWVMENQRKGFGAEPGGQKLPSEAIDYQSSLIEYPLWFRYFLYVSLSLTETLQGR